MYFKKSGMQINSIYNIFNIGYSTLYRWINKYSNYPQINKPDNEIPTIKNYYKGNNVKIYSEIIRDN